MPRSHRSYAVVAALALVACGGKGKEAPVTSQGVADSTADYSKDIASTVASASAAAQGMTSLSLATSELDALLAQLGLDASSSGAALRADPRIAKIASALRARPSRLASARAFLASQVAGEDPGAVAAAEIERVLREKIFNQANLESSDSTSATFLLHGAVVCDRMSDGSPDQECIAAFDQLQIRIQAVPHDGGIDLRFMVLPEKYRPTTLKLTSVSVAVEVDLGQSKQAAARIAELEGKTIELPSVCEGVVEAKLVVTGPESFTVQASVLEEVRVEGATSDGPVAISIAAANPALKLDLDATARKVTFTASIAPVSVTGPMTNGTTGAPAGTMTASAGGLAFRVVLTGDDDAVQVEDASIGGAPLVVKYKSAQGVETEVLRATLGQAFDLSLSEHVLNGARYTTFAFSPALDVTAVLHTAPLVAIGQEQDPATLDDTYTIHAAGSFTQHPDVCDPYQSCTPGPVRVGASSSFSIASINPADSFTASASQSCIWHDDPVDAGENAEVGMFREAACQ